MTKGGNLVTTEISKQLLKYLEKHQRELMNDLESFVKKESPSLHKPLVDECGHFLQQLFKKHLQTDAEVIQQTEVGNHLKFTVGSGEEQILIIGHFDTVWDQGRLPYRVEDNKAYGPGIFDMKGGIIQALWAVKAIRDSNLVLNKKIVFFCNSDEEIGSLYSRPYIEDEARKSKLVLVVEPAAAKSGALKTERKGVGIFNLVVRGRSSHAGNHHADGINALEELARQIVALHELTDYEKGTTVNVGVAQGGTRSNVVPDYAEATIDLRVTTINEAKRMTDAILGLKPFLKGASIEVSGGINRPPMERTDQTAMLFEIARTVGSELGMELTEASVGGGSDGNFTAAQGIPTLDGLGVEGDGPHAENEHILIDTLPKRSALVASLLLRL
jgi:glutamate carboxypeptidase